MPDTQTAAAPRAGKDAADIRPFQVNIPEAQLADLRRRIKATRWPEKETVADATQGVQLATIQAVARYWATEYDWRKVEARLNALPQFITEIDGLDIHFIHVRSKHENALPLIVTHGWPGSVIEQLKVIEPLTNPTAHGGNAADAFHVVIPSMPGYGFSGKPTDDRLGPRPHRPRLDRADEAPRLHALRGAGRRLGCVRHGADGRAGSRRNCSASTPTCRPRCRPRSVKALSAGNPAARRSRPTRSTRSTGSTSSSPTAWPTRSEMANHPQTLYGIADSPIGLAAWFLDHDLRSYELIARVFDGQREGLTRDDVLDNITLTWLTNTAISSARLYRENKRPFFVPMGVNIPVAVSAFPDELYQVPAELGGAAYPKLIHYNKLDKGGHFAAWEQPELLVEELRAGFKSLRRPRERRRTRRLAYPEPLTSQDTRLEMSPMRFKSMPRTSSQTKEICHARCRLASAHGRLVIQAQTMTLDSASRSPRRQGRRDCRSVPSRRTFPRRSSTTCAGASTRPDCPRRRPVADRVARRAARDDPEARALLGDGIRLAQGARRG